MPRQRTKSQTILHPASAIFVLGALTLSVASAQSLTIVNPSFSSVAVQCIGGYSYQADAGATCESFYPQQDFNVEAGIGWTFSPYLLGGPGLTGPNTAFDAPSFTGLPFSEAALLQNRSLIFQKLTGFVPGRVYELTFYLGSRYSSSPCCDGNQTVVVTIDGNPIGLWGLASFTPFTLRTALFRAGSGGSHILGFEGTVQPTAETSSTAFISGVSIEAVSDQQ